MKLLNHSFTPPKFADAISPSADSCNNGESIYKSPLDHSAAKHRDERSAGAIFQC